MHEARARHALELRVVRQQRVLQRVRTIARARVHDEARRLVDHDDRGVLVHDVERQLFRRHAGLGRQARFDCCGFAADHQIARAGGQPLIRTAPSSIQRWMRVREYWGNSCGERLIEAAPGIIRGQLEAVGLELGGQAVGPMAGGGRYTSRVRRPFQIQTGKLGKRQTFHAINANRRHRWHSYLLSSAWP